MKYCIEGDYKDNTMVGNMQIQNADNTDLKDFIMYGMPGLIQDLFERFGKNLKEEAKEKNISYDKILGIMSLMTVMCQNTLSEKLTTSLNEFLADDPDQNSEENSNETNGNNWDLLLGNK